VARSQALANGPGKLAARSRPHVPCLARDHPLPTVVFAHERSRTEAGAGPEDHFRARVTALASDLRGLVVRQDADACRCCNEVVDQPQACHAGLRA
jgi:hypothetical protein